MGPTVVQTAAFDVDDGNVVIGGSSNGGRGIANRRNWGDEIGRICAVIAGCSGSCLTDAFRIPQGEVGLEGVPCPLCNRLDAPRLRGGCEESGLFEHGQCQCDCGNVCDGGAACGCNELDFNNFLPQVFLGIVRIPWRC
jgi:hypothetical protein